MKRTLKKVGSTLLALSMLSVLIPGQAFAAEIEVYHSADDEYTQTVEGDIVSTEEGVFISTGAGLVSVEVLGSVTSVGEGVNVCANGGDVELQTGDLTVHGEVGAIVGAWNGSEVELNLGNISTDGNGTPNLNSVGLVVDNEGASVKVNAGDITVKDDYVANGVWVDSTYDESETNVNVGNIEAENGVMLIAEEGTASVVAGDIDAIQVGVLAGVDSASASVTAGKISGTTGIVADAVGEGSSVKVNAEDVKASAVGVSVYDHRGSVEIGIDGNLSADTALIVEAKEGCATDILVTGTIDGSAASIIVAGDCDADALQITTWKIDLDGREHAVESMDVSTAVGVFTANNTGFNETAEAVEKNINYIIKVEQPQKGAEMSAVDENGNALAQSHGFDVAKENEKVVLKIDLEKDYRVTGAFNGLGEKQDLMVDEDGNYYVIVARGGGVYLSVELVHSSLTMIVAQDKTQNLSLKFFENRSYSVRLKDGGEESGTIEMKDGKIVLVSSAGNENVVGEDGKLQYQVGGDASQTYELNFTAEEMATLFNLLR